MMRYLTNWQKAISTLKSDEAGTTNLRIRSENGVEQERQVLTVKEKGLYRLIFKSRKPAAERMKDWVFSEVLPSIRKTGKYSIPESPKPQQLLIEQSVKVAESIDRIQHSIVSIAEKIGIKTNASTRVKLGNFVGKLGLERVREDRLCNVEMREIWCYRNDKATQNAVREWHEELALN